MKYMTLENIINTKEESIVYLGDVANSLIDRSFFNSSNVHCFNHWKDVQVFLANDNPIQCLIIDCSLQYVEVPKKILEHAKKVAKKLIVINDAVDSDYPYLSCREVSHQEALKLLSTEVKEDCNKLSCQMTFDSYAAFCKHMEVNGELAIFRGQKYKELKQINIDRPMAVWAIG